MRYKRFTPEQVKASDSGGTAEEGRVSFVVATLNRRDSDGDVTLPGAFGTQHVVMVPAHDWSHVPIGKGTVSEQGNRAVVEVKMNLRIPEGRSWYEAIKFDAANGAPLQQYSYGYDVLDSEHGTHEGQRVRVLKRLKVFEVSPVLLGAGVGTGTLSVKRAGLDAADRAELERIHLRLIRAKNAAAVADMQTRKVLDRAARAVSIGYSRDLDWSVPSTTRETVKAAVEAYAPMLDLDPGEIEVKWFSGEGDPEFVEFTSLQPLAGLCHPKADGRAIWLHSDLTDCDAWTTAAHELRHLAGGDEDEARVYEVKAAMDWRNR